ADRAGVVGEGALDALADPPRRVGAELEAEAVLELVHGPHQAAVAFLDEVAERQAAAAVALGDGDDEAEVAFGQLAAGVLELALPAADDGQQRLELVEGGQVLQRPVAQLLDV